METLELFGYRVTSAPASLLVEHCLACAMERRKAVARPALLMALNPEKIMRAQRNPALAEALRSADILIPDGIGVCLAARLLHGARLQRLAGCDLVPLLCQAAAERGARVFVYGARPQVNERACRALTERFPGLVLVGRRDGYAPVDGEGSAFRQIAELEPDIVFAALGSPMQEEWMVRFGSRLPVGLVQSVGGTLDVLAGTVRRAPPSFRALGLEWLYRLLAEPWRWRRQLVLVRFVGYVARQRLVRPAARIP